MAPTQPALRPSPGPYIHIAGQRCPVCDQPIPNEKAQEVHARMEARERALTEAANARARDAWMGVQRRWVGSSGWLMVQFGARENQTNPRDRPRSMGWQFEE
jgi:uncharacterized protein with PIN domain